MRAKRTTPHLPGAQARSLSSLPDDRLGTVAVSLAVSELRWTPDVAPAVMDRISRDAVAYPEQFDRRSQPPSPPGAPPPSGRSAGRVIGRLAVFAIVLAIIVVLVVFAASASVADAQAAAERILPIAMALA